jgi:hypothetical protein
MSRVPSINPRHQRAAAEGRRSDRAFFRAHPERDYHSRLSLPFETDKPVMLAKRAGKQVASFPVAGSPRAVPDNERFLSLLWSHIVAINPDPEGTANLTFEVTPQAHADMLRMAGIEVGEGN